MRYVFSLIHQFIADDLFVTLEALGQSADDCNAQR